MVALRGRPRRRGDRHLSTPGEPIPVKRCECSPGIREWSRRNVGPEWVSW
jgi:hypothetical protein